MDNQDQNELKAKQEKFNQDISKMTFKLNVKMLDLPLGDARNDQKKTGTVAQDLIDFIST